MNSRTITGLPRQLEEHHMSGHSHDDPSAIAVGVQDVHAAAAAPAPLLIDDLVVANHILFDQGIVDGFGHISVRHDQQSDRFLLARNMAPGRVTADDIVEFTLDGEAVNARGRRVYLERFIHGEIYRKRPDVMAVVHSHSHSIVPLSVVKGVPLRAMFHMAGFIGQSAPVFEIRDVAGDATSLLISDRRLGAALADLFAASDIVLMRGHGSTVAGQSIPHVVYRAIYAELNARYQVAAGSMGDITYLTEGECAATAATIEAQMQRPWDLWVEEARKRRRT
jgi:ribulose-5-phosphate 4-epimerase/fuculose-1-phosphate aldolase